ILGKHSAISEYQVTQDPAGARITVCLTDPVDVGDLAAEIAHALTRSGLEQPSVVVEPAASIPRLATGKLKRFIPLEPDARPPMQPV
ncbi:MAG TPA: hypothetical protein VMB91_05475, partial [Solirubrobacteraceae bacterium]|nr:hypothetical protein [Solirubrobacteraceae bacterium]